MFVSGNVEFQGETSPTFKKIVVEGVFGNVESIGLEMLVYSSRRNVDKALESDPVNTQRPSYTRTAECELIFSPASMRSLYEWLGEKLENYEALYGKIPAPDEIQSRFKKYLESKKSKNPNT